MAATGTCSAHAQSLFGRPATLQFSIQCSVEALDLSDITVRLTQRLLGAPMNFRCEGYLWTRPKKFRKPASNATSVPWELRDAAGHRTHRLYFHADASSI